MSNITDKTKVTVAVLIPLLGFSVWLTTIYFQTSANAAAIVEIRRSQDKFVEMAQDIAVIRVQMEEMNKKIDHLER
jgi:hypothetical protein